MEAVVQQKSPFKKPTLVYQMGIWLWLRKEYLIIHPSQTAACLETVLAGSVQSSATISSSFNLLLHLVTMSAGPRSKDLAFIRPSVHNIYISKMSATFSVLPDL